MMCTPTIPPFLFTVVSNNGKADLLITFRNAVEIKDVEGAIHQVIRDEIAACGESPDAWHYTTTPLNEDVFDIIHHYYEHGFGGPRP